MSNVSVVPTLTVDDSVLVASNVLEDDYPAYSSTTTYAEGQRVVVQDSHEVYESLQGGNLDKPPKDNKLWWIRVSATNRWKMFDMSSSTQTRVVTGDYYEFLPGSAIDVVALINIRNVESVRVRMLEPGGVAIYDRVHDTNLLQSRSDWYSWFFDRRERPHSLYVTGLPTNPIAKLRIDFTVSGEGFVGTTVFGSTNTVGMRGARVGARIGIQEFSRKERNSFGDVLLVKRPFAKRMSLTVQIDNNHLDSTFNLLADISATPCLWVGSERFSSMMVFGFISNFDIVIPYESYSDCSIDIEGLT